MKAEAIMRAMENAEVRGMAYDAMDSIPDGGQPSELPVTPETAVEGPPSDTPPVDTSGAPMFDGATGLPVIAQNNAPDGFPAEAEDGEAEAILGFLF